ncbi:MAG: PAS domain-containing protein [Chloroflexi bacterium]|nr:PAS domain-containing protein [Chloroflexota bacterium]
MTNNPREISGVISRVNNLGTVTEALFSRLYRGLRQRARQEARPTADHPTDRNRQLQRAVRRRDLEIERLNAILATISEGIIMQDLEGRIIVVNAAARRLIGSRKDIWDSELGTLFNAYRDVTQVESELAPLGEPTRIQVNNMILGAQVAAVADSQGERLGTLIVLRDVTRDALSDRLKNEFVTAISHELRTPMAVIKGMSDVLMNQPADRPPNRRFLETLSRNVDILDRMIVELLDISEMSASAFSIRRDPVNLEELIWNVVNGMIPEVKRAQLDVAVMLRDVDRLQIVGDDQRLRWSLGHLLQNAIRYTEPGGHIIVTASGSDAKRVAIQVVDTGVGISKKDLPHVFERFYRGEPRTASGKLLDPRGLGQGLFVARSVAEAHGGYLTVRSEPGQGSIFTMVLPITPPA